MTIIKHLDDPGSYQSRDLDLVHDAHLLASLQEKMKKSELDPSFLSEVIDRDFVTDSGRSLAYELLQASATSLRSVAN